MTTNSRTAGRPPKLRQHDDLPARERDVARRIAAAQFGLLRVARVLPQRWIEPHDLAVGGDLVRATEPRSCACGRMQHGAAVAPTVWQRRGYIKVAYEPQLDYGRSLEWIAPELTDAGLAMTEDHPNEPRPSRTWAGIVDRPTFERFADALHLDDKTAESTFRLLRARAPNRAHLHARRDELGSRRRIADRVRVCLGHVLPPIYQCAAKRPLACTYVG